MSCHLSVFSSFCLSVFQSFVFLYFCITIFSFFCLFSFRIYIFSPIYLFVSLSFRLSVSLLLCLFVFIIGDRMGGTGLFIVVIGLLTPLTAMVISTCKANANCLRRTNRNSWKPEIRCSIVFRCSEKVFFRSTDSEPL